MLAVVWACAFVAASASYESVVIAPRPLGGMDTSADVSVIDANRVPRAGEDLPQLMVELPGVSVAHTGGIGSTALVSLRGSAWNQVNIYLDGVLLNSSLGGAVDISTIPLGDIDRIEVYRGVTPTMFGSSNIGGVVSITTRAPTLSGAKVGAGVGSFGTYNADAQASGKDRLYVAVHGLQATGDFPYVSDGGTALNANNTSVMTRFNNALLQGSGALRLQDGPWRLGAWVLARDQGLAGYGTRVTHTAQQRVQRYLAYLAHGDDAQLSASVESLAFQDPNGEVAGIPSVSQDFAVRLNLHMQATHTFTFATLSSVADVRLDQILLHDARDDLTAPPSTRFFAGLGAQLDIAWAAMRAHIVPALRLELNHDARTGRNQFMTLSTTTTSNTQLLPLVRLGARKRWDSGVVLRVNLARYARMPSLSELFGDSGFLLGNPQLTPETGYNFDLGGSWASSWMTASITAFGSLASDLIQFQQNSFGQQRAINIGAARILGVEANVEARPVSWATLRAQGTFTDARDVSPTALGALARQLPLRPRVTGYVRAEARYLGVGAYTDFTGVAGNALDPANFVFLPPRLMLGVGLFATWRALSINFTAQNINNNQVVDFAGFPLPGRSFFASISIDPTQGDPT